MTAIDIKGMETPELLELIHAACAEAMTRGTECLSAAQRELIRAMAACHEGVRMRAEEARRIAEETAERVRREEAHRKERELWARRKGIALVFHPIFGDGCSVQVWMKEDRTREKRVYVNGAYRAELACLYVTGNHRKAPGTLEVSKPFREHQEQIRTLCLAVAEEWNALRVDVDAAIGWDGEAIPLKATTPAGTAFASAPA